MELIDLWQTYPHCAKAGCRRYVLRQNNLCDTCWTTARLLGYVEKNGEDQWCVRPEKRRELEEWRDGR